MAKNVLGTTLIPCNLDPLTGFFRTGCCETSAEDEGMHTICACMTREFLDYSFQSGNDLITPRPEMGFPGLKPGDYWCLCMIRWLEALHAGVAPPVRLEATHEQALDYVGMEILSEYADKNGTVKSPS